jgi:hypothetical protein
MKWNLPFTLQELFESLIGTGDEKDQLALMFATPTDGVEAGAAKSFEETSVLSFGVLSIDPRFIFRNVIIRGRTGFEDDDEVDITLPHG